MRQDKDTKLKQARNEAMYRLYVKGLEEGRISNMRTAGEFVRRQPAPSYFISSHSASLLIGKIDQLISVILPNEGYRARALTIYGEYLRYLREHPDCGMSREAVLNLIVEQPAPEFFVDSETARQILQNEVEKVRSAKWNG